MDMQSQSGGKQAATSASDRSVMAPWSIEATLPKTEEIEALARLVAPGTEVFLSTLPHVTLDRQVDAAQQVRRAGLEPVPHIAARYFADEAAARALLHRLVGAAEVSRVLIIGGDAGDPRGPFESSLSLIATGIFSDTPIGRIGIAGYPDGHPKIATASLQTALAEKLAALSAAGLAAEIVTQFCFDARAIAAWIADVRSAHPSVPIRIGMAGPTNPRTLMRYASRCGVKTSLTGLGQRLSMAFKLLKSVSPAPIVRHLDGRYDALSPDGAIIAHFFSFGGLTRTAEWATETAGKGQRQ